MKIISRYCRYCDTLYQADEADLRGYCSTICLLQASIKQLEARVNQLDSELRIAHDRTNGLRHELALSYQRVGELEAAARGRDWLTARPGEFG